LVLVDVGLDGDLSFILVYLGARCCWLIILVLETAELSGPRKTEGN